MSLTRCSIASVIIHSSLALRTVDHSIYDDGGNDNTERNVSLDRLLEAFSPEHHEHVSPSLGTSTLQDHSTYDDEGKNKIERNVSLDHLLEGFSRGHHEHANPLLGTSTLQEKRTVLMTAHITAHGSSSLQKPDHNTSEKHAKNVGWLSFQQHSLKLSYEFLNIVSKTYSGLFNSPNISCHPNCTFEADVEKNRTSTFSLLYQSSEQLHRSILTQIFHREDVSMSVIVVCLIIEVFMICAAVYCARLPVGRERGSSVTTTGTGTGTWAFGANFSMPTVTLTTHYFNRGSMENQPSSSYSPRDTKSDNTHGSVLMDSERSCSVTSLPTISRMESESTLIFAPIATGT